MWPAWSAPGGVFAVIKILGKSREGNREDLSAGQEWQQRLRRLSGQIEKQKGHLEHIHSELREKQTILENLRENLGELREEGEGTAGLEQEIQALQMAAETVREASKEVCSQWEGRLNRRVSEI